MSETPAVELRVIADLPPFLRSRAFDFDRTHNLKVSNPILRAQSAAAQAMAKNWLDDNKLTVTAHYGRNLMLHARLLSEIKGERDEQDQMKSPQSQKRIADLAASMKQNGYDATEAVAIRVYPPGGYRRTPGGVRVFEGNHRIRAAIAAGIKTIPVDWKWCGGSELETHHHPILYRDTWE